MMRSHLSCFLICMLVSSIRGEDNRRSIDSIDDVLDLMEDDVKDLAAQVELLYKDRCNIETFDNCSSSNYDSCLSVFPASNCSFSEVVNNPICASNGCGALVDFTVSSVSAGPGNDFVSPKDEKIVESICFAQKLDKWFKKRRENQTDYNWGKNVTKPSSYYFASRTGSFRGYPARPSERCSNYDPRVRPWYLAASSGPKNLVLMLDVSGTMRGRMADLKWTARRLVDELTDLDRVSIVLFAAEARVIGATELVKATTETKEWLDNFLGDLDEEDGRANFGNAFKMTFDLLDTAIDNGTVDCHSSIIFVTSSTIDDSSEKDTLIGEISERMENTTEKGNREVQLFAFSIADLENSTQVGVHDFPQKLACSVEHGFWKRIGKDDDMRAELHSYINLYSWGLGGRDDGDVSWVTPYAFFTGGVIGTTVSLPVFSSSDSSAPTFLGVVGIDIVLNTPIDQFPSRENEINNCRILKLDDGKIEAYRCLGGSTSKCNTTTNCNETKQVEDMLCPNANYPPDLWVNIGADGLDATKQACCNVDPSDPSEQCVVVARASAASEITVATTEEIVPPTTVPIVGNGGSRKDDRLLWEVVLTVVGTVLGGIVSILFLVDYFRNGSMCRRREEVYEDEEESNFHSDIAP